MKKKISDIVIEFLESKNIDHVFTVSGGGCIHLIDSLGRAKKLKYICNHHEQACAMAAEGYARIKQDIGVCIVTTGPGGTNTLTGVLGCWLDSIPAIFISGQVPLSQTIRGTGCRQIGDQEHDIVSTVRSMTKYAVMIQNKDDILYELEKAYRAAIGGRPGPVWIDIPLDIQGSFIDDSELKAYDEKEPNAKPNIEEIDILIDLIEKSKKPIIITGMGIRLSKSYDLFNKILRKYNIPCLSGVHSGIDTIDNTYKYYAGRIGILGQITSNTLIQEADLIIVIGSRLNVKMTGYNVDNFAPKSKKVFIDIDPTEVYKHKFNIDLFIHSDIKEFLKIIDTKKIQINITDWQTRVENIRCQQKYYYPKHKDMIDYASLYYFMHKIKNYDNDMPIITSDGSAHVVAMQSYRLKKDQRLFTNVGCASMGYGLPAAIGACFGNNLKPLICLEGDGSIQMNIQELQTLKHYNLPIKLFVINNDGYLSIKITQQSFFDGKEFASGKNNGISFPELKKICKAYDLQYFCIKNNSEYDDILLKVCNYDGPAICELFTHPNEKHEPKVTHKGINSDGKIIPGDLTDMTITDTFNL